MIRPITEQDRTQYMQWAYDFYHSDAVLHPVPEECYRNTLNELLASDQYLQGYILEFEEKSVGYALLSKSFSPEVGGPIIWIEEIYIIPEVRGHGLGKEFFAFLDDRFGNIAKRLRLEAEPDNQRAISLYESLGFHPLPYLQMVKDS